MIENEVGHAYKHVLLDIGVELAVDLAQNVGRRRVLRRLAPQDTAANGHDERGRDAFARDIRDGDAEPFVIDFDVVEIIATDLPGRDIHSADLEAVDARRFRGQQDALDITRNL